MKTYISHKKVQAEPMTRKMAESLGLVRDIEADDAPDEDGYKVVYENNYESWSPKQVFEEGYAEEGTVVAREFFNFGQAISFLKQGYKVARKGWNGKGMFIYYVAPNKYPMSNNLMETMADRYEDNLVPYQAYIAFKTVDDTVVPWLASQTDILADDYCIVD